MPLGSSPSPDPIDRERDRTATQIDDLTAELDAIVSSAHRNPPDDEHDAEGATVGYERARVAALLGSARRHLDELDGAAERRDAGAYGRCAGCGAAIGAERLAALPAVDRCVDCAAGGAPRLAPGRADGCR